MASSNNISNGPLRSAFYVLSLRLLAILIGPLLLFVVGELIFRLNPGWTADPPATPPYNYRVPDKKMGWFVQAGYAFEGTMNDFKGNPYAVKLTFGKNGFRTYGDLNASGRKRVLFIGDSYTACAQTSDDKTWHRLLADSLPVEVFAYGAAGFGTTQEYLIVKEYMDEIKPDLVVIMFCTNDFIDNYWELEKRANYHVRMPRPYTLEDGSIVRRYAAEWPRSVKPWSRFLYWIIRRIQLSNGTFDLPPKEPAEKFIAEQREQYPLFARSVRMTDATLKNFQALLPPQTALLGVCVDGFEAPYVAFEQLCADNRIPFAGNMPAYIQRFESSECVRTDDGYHWNNRGNQLVASYLKPLIIDILDKK